MAMTGPLRAGRDVFFLDFYRHVQKREVRGVEPAFVVGGVGDPLSVRAVGRGDMAMG